MTKQEFKDKYGNLVFIFSYWYKNDLVYVSTDHGVALKLVIIPDYRDMLKCKETINSITECEEYQSIRLYDVTDGTAWGVCLFEARGDNV